MAQWQTKTGLTRRTAAGLVALATCWYSQAGTLSVEVLDRDGRPVPDVAVYALPDGGASAVAEPLPQAVMDQVDLEFVPHVLIVQTNTLIEFPNSDSVNHHVYSFSPTKAFELPLYKGNVYPPLRFEKAGVVTLGCNIHDSMLGYILVVETPHFAMTDRHGRALLAALPDDGYAIRVWTPRARKEDTPAERTVRLSGDAEGRLTVRFAEKLFPPHPQDGNLTWSDY